MIPSLPHSWSELTWRQLCDMWAMKLRYGSNADVARVVALLKLLGLEPSRGNHDAQDPVTGEQLYLLASRNNRDERWVSTAREIAFMAKEALTWLDYPYGDPGEKEQQDEKGKVIKERREGVHGYVSGMRDAMMLPQDELAIARTRWKCTGSVWFLLPQVACNNLTWEQYRALQNITPQLFAEDNTDEKTVELQAQFMAHILTPRSFALFDAAGGNIKIRPHWVYQYNSQRAERLVGFWKKQLASASLSRHYDIATLRQDSAAVLFHICFQVYQTALSYYAASYPLLFSDGGKEDPLRDALTGEVGTINTVMKYAGYAEQQQVYDSNLPFILDILNTMTKEAKEIEKMNAQIRKK